MHPTLAVIASFLLVACVEPLPTGGEPTGDCGAGALQDLVGQPGAVLDRMRFGQEVRVIRPGTAVTMDVKPDRLNIWLDRRDVIVRVVCG